MNQTPTSIFFAFAVWLRRLYDWVLSKSAHPKAEYWLAGISFVESSFFPIPPHPLLGLMCLAEPHRAIRYGIVCTVASVLGALFAYAIGYFLYASVGSFIISMLGLEASFPRAACYLRYYGAEIIFVAGATPIPFKLFTLSAGFIQMNIAVFLFASTLSRGAQFLLIGGLFRLFGAPVRVFIEKYLTLLSVLFVILVIGGFVILGFVDLPTSETSESVCAEGLLETAAVL